MSELKPGTAYTEYHPRWYRRRVSTWWWLARWSYLILRLDPTAEDIADHWDEVSATDPYTCPTSIFDEVSEICQRLGITG